MGLLCVICGMAKKNLADVKPARYVINGQSVCHDHVDNVAADSEKQTAIIITKKSPASGG